MNTSTPPAVSIPLGLLSPRTPYAEVKSRFNAWEWVAVDEKFLISYTAVPAIYTRTYENSTFNLDFFLNETE